MATVYLVEDIRYLLPVALKLMNSRRSAAAFFTAPTAFRAIKRDDSEGEHIRRYDLSKLRTLFLVGERCDPPTLERAER